MSRLLTRDRHCAHRALGVAATLIAALGLSCSEPPLDQSGTGDIRLVFHVPPSNITAGEAFSPPIEVRAVDAKGRWVRRYEGEVTLGTEVWYQTHPAQVPRPGFVTLSVAQARYGRAVFTDYRPTSAGTHEVRVEGPQARPTANAKFMVFPGPAVGIAIADPTHTPFGRPIWPAVRVRVHDAFGNAVPDAGTISIRLDANPSGAQLLGTTTRSALDNDYAEFTDLVIDRSGTGYTLHAERAGLPPATSTAFDVRVPDGDIVFVAPPVTPAGGSAGGVAVLHRIRSDGSGSIRLHEAEPETQVGDPAWSPDGRRLLFSKTMPGTTTRAIYAMNADGTAEVRLSPPACGADCRQARWSPDGTSIVFNARQEDGSYRLMLMDDDGGNMRVLLPDLPSSGPADWSPDGERIVVSLAGSEPGLHLVTLANGSITRLTTGSHGAPAWSPDGSRVAFQNGNAIDVINADGTGHATVAWSNYYVYALAWSPDGTRILYESVSQLGPTYQHYLYVMNADGSGVIRLTAQPGQQPAWRWRSPPD
jgi:hypothetical protein